MTTPILYPLLTTALYYLGAKAMITEFLWSRYSPRLDSFMSCAACSGTWYGAWVAAIVGAPLNLPFLGIDGRTWYTPVLVALCSLVWTPLLAALHVRALLYLSNAGEIGAGEITEIDSKTVSSGMIKTDLSEGLSLLPDDNESFTEEEAANVLNDIISGPDSQRGDAVIANAIDQWRSRSGIYG